MILADAFAQIAGTVSEAFDGPYHPARLRWTLSDVKDDGGSIITPGAAQDFVCKVQVNHATDAMRAEAGFIETDMRLLVIAKGIWVPVDLQITVDIPLGEWAGTWELQSGTRDTLGFAYDARGRRISSCRG